MIAIITSCINPFKATDHEPKSFFNLTERLEQTKNSINYLKKLSFSKIYLLDNSTFFNPDDWFNDELTGISVRHVKQYQFKNKGINELLLILSLLDELPDNESIFKISGRYYPNSNFENSIGENFDFKLKSYAFQSKKGTISTRGYFVRNKKIYEQFLLACLSETLSYTKRIVGFRSALNALKEIFFPTFSIDNNIAIELGSARILKTNLYKIHHVEKIGITGQIAGFKTLDLVEE